MSSGKKKSGVKLSTGELADDLVLEEIVRLITPPSDPQKLAKWFRTRLLRVSKVLGETDVLPSSRWRAENRDFLRELDIEFTEAAKVVTRSPTLLGIVKTAGIPNPAMWFCELRDDIQQGKNTRLEQAYGVCRAIELFEARLADESCHREPVRVRHRRYGSLQPKSPLIEDSSPLRAAIDEGHVLSTQGPQRQTNEPWKPPLGYVGAKAIVSDERFQKDGRSPSRSTIQEWVDRSKKKTDNNLSVVKDPATQECHYPELWVHAQIRRWNPRKPKP